MSARPILPHDCLAPKAATRIASFHARVVDQVRSAVERHDVVVIGMAQNPHVRRVRRALADAGIGFEYLELGSYLSGWRRRLAVKLWSGWPTFPQVFVAGVLIGGDVLTREALTDGSLRRRLEEAPSRA